ncbi:MAG: hypothetical protein DHS20C11_08930 [Lysobacteraceae bacterium]|nr:MAG: hypothetical protein DHS20C11_08930 [Xanthomonadaceae bacterium]
MNRDNRSSGTVAIRLGALGDMIMFLPVLHAMHQRFQCKIDVVTAGPWSPFVLSHSPYVGRVEALDTTKRWAGLLSRRQRQVVAWLKADPPKRTYLFEQSRKADHLLQRAGIDRHYVVHAADRPSQPNEHQTDYHRRLLGAEHDHTVPQLDHRRLDIDEARQWLRTIGATGSKLVLLQPGNKRTMRPGRLDRASNHKHWPTERWSSLAAAVADSDPQIKVLICGVPAEQALAQDIAQRSCSDRVLAVADQLPLPRLFALSTLADAMISVDTGPAHVAAAAGCPLVVMFGQTNPDCFAPRGVAQVEIVDAGGSGLTTLPVAAIMAAFENLSPRRENNET